MIQRTPVTILVDSSRSVSVESFSVSQSAAAAGTAFEMFYSKVEGPLMQRDFLFTPDGGGLQKMQNLNPIWRGENRRTSFTLTLQSSRRSDH